MKFAGKVIKGVQIGKKFGIATANLGIEKKPDLKPGVYLVNINFKDQALSGLMHFGDLKTFGGGFSIEVHILDFETEIYGETLQIQVLKYLRPIITFPSGDALFTQIATDITQARKYFIRAEIKKSWDNLNQTDRDELGTKALQKIQTLEIFQKAKWVYLFAPDQYEINFSKNLMQQFPEKRWGFPKLEGKQIKFYEVEKYANLKIGRYDLLEPSADIPALAPDLIIVPAQAGNQTGQRLGRGGGFYDRFLSQTDTYTCTILPAFAEVKDLPCESHDRSIQQIIFV